MAEEPKDTPQDESMTASDTTTESPHESELNDAGSAEQEEAAVAPAKSETKSMEPQDETFWEESVDASAVNLADAGTAQEGKEEEDAAEAAPASGDTPPGVSEDTTTGEATESAPTDETTPEEQSVSAASETPREQSAPADEEAAQLTPEDELQPVENSVEETVTEKTEEATPEATAPEEESVSAESETPREQSAPADEEGAQLTPEDEPPQVEESDKEVVAEEESATEAAPEAGDTPAEHPSSDESRGQVKVEDASQEVKDTAEEITVENKEDGDEETAAVTGEEAPAESAVTAEGEKKEGEEDNRELVAEMPEDPESPTQEEIAVQDTSEVKEPESEKEEAVSAGDPAEAAGEGIKPPWRPSRRATMMAAGIVLLIIGSIGYSVVPFFRSGDTAISTFLSGKPDNAYDMKFFLPLNVGYEEARFVKVTIAIELMDKGFKKEIDKNVSQLRQEVIDLLLTKSPQEVQSSKGKKLLRQEITSRLNHHFAKDCIKETYFTELVIL